MKTAVFSGSDSNYFNNLKNLVLSFNEKKCNEESDLYIFSVDLTIDQINFLKSQNVNILEPNWDIEIKFQAPNWKKLLVIRPFLKNYVNNYDNFIWLDADIIIQDNRFINDFNQASELGKLSIVPETDQDYLFYKNKNNNLKRIFFNYFKPTGWVYKNNKKYFGSKFANNILDKPLFNAGVYSLPKDSKIWKLWSEEYSKIIKNSSDDYCLNMDQATLNKVIYENSDRVHIFDKKYNWICKNLKPIKSKNKNYFVSPNIPNEKIILLHLTGNDLISLDD